MYTLCEKWSWRGLFGLARLMDCGRLHGVVVVGFCVHPALPSGAVQLTGRSPGGRGGLECYHPAGSAGLGFVFSGGLALAIWFPGALAVSIGVNGVLPLANRAGKQSFFAAGCAVHTFDAGGFWGCRPRRPIALYALFRFPMVLSMKKPSW